MWNSLTKIFLNLSLNAAPTGGIFFISNMAFINANGKIIEQDRAFIRVDDHSYRYGDGLFETMKVVNARISLSELHFERLFNGLKLLKFQMPPLLSPARIEREIIDLCKKNNCTSLARVRLSVSAGHGGLYDDEGKLRYIIECSPLTNTINQLNENGLVIDVFPAAKKSCDIFSNLKTASHLPYAMAARFARENQLNDCLLFNTNNSICDSTIANVFWIADGKIHTPPLSEGCIAGVMRSYLISRLLPRGYELLEKVCETSDLENADEVFLTNAIHGIKWVKEFRNKNFTNTRTKEIYSRVFIEK